MSTQTNMPTVYTTASDHYHEQQRPKDQGSSKQRHTYSVKETVLLRVHLQYKAASPGSKLMHLLFVAQLVRSRCSLKTDIEHSRPSP